MYISFEMVSLCLYIVEAGLKFMGLLHQSPKCWDYRHAPKFIVYKFWYLTISWSLLKLKIYWLNIINYNEELSHLKFFILGSFELSPLSWDRFQWFSFSSNYEEYFEGSFGAVSHRKILWRTRQAPWPFLFPRCVCLDGVSVYWHWPRALDVFALVSPVLGLQVCATLLGHTEHLNRFLSGHIYAWDKGNQECSKRIMVERTRGTDRRDSFEENKTNSGAGGRWEGC